MEHISNKINVCEASISKAKEKINLIEDILSDFNELDDETNEKEWKLEKQKNKLSNENPWKQRRDLRLLISSLDELRIERTSLQQMGVSLQQMEASLQQHKLLLMTRVTGIIIIYFLFIFYI